MKRGFTLIETVVYVALLGLIMSTMLVGVYQILQAQASTSNKTIMQEESTFVLRKIDFALSGISALPVVGGSGCTQTLHTTKYDGTNWYFKIIGSEIDASENGSTYYPITTANISATCLKFNLIPAGSPTGVTATVTIGGTDFVTTKFLRN